MTESKTHTGACHCGNIRFVFETRSEPARLGARRCGCTFCQKHGGVWTSDPGGALRVSVADSSLLSRYAFGTETAHFYVCARCGTVPLVVSEIDGVQYAVVSVNALDDRSPFSEAEAPSDFSGENTGSRLERRKKNWIPDVSFVSSLG